MKEFVRSKLPKAILIPSNLFGTFSHQFLLAPQGPEGSQHLAAELSQLTNLQSLELDLRFNELGPGPQASPGKAQRGSEVLAPLSF